MGDKRGGLARDTMAALVPEGVVLEYLKEHLEKYTDLWWRETYGGDGVAGATKDVSERLQEEFGNATVKAHETAIAGAVKEYLAPGSRPPLKRTNEPALREEKNGGEKGEGEGKPAKRAKVTSSTGEISFPLSTLRFLKVREYKGKRLADIWEHYEKEGELCPGKKGISLNASQWESLFSSIDQVASAYESKDLTYLLKLTSNGLRRAVIKEYKGKYYVDIREWYEKDGDTRPGKRGIMLSSDQWAKLTENAAAANEAMK